MWHNLLTVSHMWFFMYRAGSKKCHLGKNKYTNYATFTLTSGCVQELMLACQHSHREVGDCVYVLTGLFGQLAVERLYESWGQTEQC